MYNNNIIDYIIIKNNMALIIDIKITKYTDVTEIDFNNRYVYNQ